MVTIAIRAVDQCSGDLMVLNLLSPNQHRESHKQAMNSNLAQHIMWTYGDNNGHYDSNFDILLYIKLVRVWRRHGQWEPVRRSTPDHLLLDRSPNIGPLISRWELGKFKNRWNKSFRTTKILTLLYQQFSNLIISQRDMSGPRLGALSNDRCSGGTRQQT